MAYSEDFRKRAIEYMDEGHTSAELYEAFRLYPSRISEWRKLLKETGELKPRYRETRSSKIDMKKLEQELERNPDAYLHELAAIFGCTEQAIFYALKRIKITVKKTIYIRRKISGKTVFVPFSADGFYHGSRCQ
jgi:transposase